MSDITTPSVIQHTSEPTSVMEEDIWPGTNDGYERLWTPHRVAYLNGESKPKDTKDESVCPFCVGPTKSDSEALIVYRGKTCFVVCNLFPYNSGHLLVCPYRHVADITEIAADEREELIALSAKCMQVLRKTNNPAGFNLGMNQGAVAGAGIAGHIHQHVVPRFLGDANFFPIIAKTKAIPFLLAQTRETLAKAWYEI